MCTVVILRNADGEVGHSWPLILAANRDEMADRPWRPPGRHWPDRPNVMAGMDELAGGSWLGVNDEGVLAAILNRVGTLGPADGMRSRGELPLDALDHADAISAVEALADVNPAAYRPFNMIVADNRDAYWISLVNSSEPVVRIEPIPDGVSMVTAHDLNALTSDRIRMHLPRFQQAEQPRPQQDGDGGDWRAWEALMANGDRENSGSPTGAMCIADERGFGTVSAATIALPSVDHTGARPIFRFCPGRPGEAPFSRVTMETTDEM